MDDQNKVNDANGTDNNGKAQEPETVITTKEALKAIGHNAKVKAKETWTKAKPKLKKVVIATAVIGGAAYAFEKMNQQPALEQKDDDWVDDEIEGEAILKAFEDAKNIDSDQATTESNDVPAENAE